ncbi:MAG: FtsQ-type POTRA domain-containing protein [Flavobacteriales bacterium]|nr:FtsQ-type POTRA domain-containing protein [Flavobacteriales bacterium]
MKKMNRAMVLLSYCIAACGVVTLLGFIGSSKADAVCEGIDVELVRSHSNQLITEDFIRQTLLNTSGQIVGENLREVDYDKIEDALKRIPFIYHATVYTTVDNQLEVTVHERTPIARLIDDKGVSALLDTEGFLMPVSGVSAARLPVITGELGLEKLLIESNLHVGDSVANPNLAAAFEIATLIAADEIWTAQFQHLSFSNDGELVAYPQVGNHEIVFGSGRLEEKLDVLRTFYKKGMNEEAWNKYKSINLKYKDQIVCTKKYPYGGT